MSERKDGGPAFPETHVAEQILPGGMIIAGWHGQSGMSLRDYFAAHAPEWVGSGLSSDELIKARWAWADAMLAERDK